ncbi:TIGR00730 family Rossman fold protein [Rhizobacter sp. Root1221]|uniref:TIGR00730 family Rossman fold protein n=1 Tax=Rhizobacter sp. Root1221 TaxID=1736433 RepID=UPI0009EC24FC|nr:TIGR00730 family Rossman fold protein [Rhizobacter sp. Root1221]
MNQATSSTATGAPPPPDAAVPKWPTADLAINDRVAPRLRIHAIVGPTGVGKSAEAERLARELRCPIVVADRIQCFVDLKVTSARATDSKAQGVVRYHLAERRVCDGDMTARSAGQALTYILGALASKGRFVIVEGGSISLLQEFFSSNDLPFDVSVDVRLIGDRQAHRQRLLHRAHQMLSPPLGGPGLLQELAAAWHIEAQRAFVASVNGPEAVVAWCQRHGIDPADLPRKGLSQQVLDELAEAIADVHLEHAEDQERAFLQLFRNQEIRRFPAEPPMRGTRAAARRDVEATKPDAPSRLTVTVYCGSSLGRSPVYRAQAAELGRRLADSGFDIVYGGASIGCMGALADGALQAGGRVVGVIPKALLEVEIGHPELTDLYVVDSMHERKALMEQLADAFIALPGGLGTAEELLEMLTWRQLGLHQKPCLLLDANGFWTDAIRSLGHLIDAGFVTRKDVAIARILPDAATLVATLAAELSR